MSSTREATVHAATIRALSGDPTVRLRGPRVLRGDAPARIAAAHLRLDVPELGGARRGAVDGLALRLRHSDAELHSRLAPEGAAARWVFELLEQFRVESLADPGQPGVRANLRRLHEQWSLAYHGAGLTSSEAGIVLYTVAQICRSRVTREPVVEATEDLLEGTRLELAPHIGHAVAELRGARAHQARYATHALSIAAHVESLIGGQMHDELAHEADDTVLTLYVEPDGDALDGTAAGPGRPGRTGRGVADYAPYTTAYDQVQSVRTTLPAAQLKRLRQRLDELVASSGHDVRRIARDVHRYLREPTSYGWSGGNEEGYVDGRRLSRLVTSPVRRDLFRLPGIAWEPDCHVAILVDCSGSMKANAAPVSVFVDVLAHALDLAGVGNEVLGFTTAAWSGGRALRDWERDGRPARPGRLNELAHLVLREPDLPWRKARAGIAALLRPDLFREGIDGEAVQWAARRVASRDVGRRVLVVLSDGSPMDSATARVNGPTYLDEHLRSAVVEEQERGLEVVGIGVGSADLDGYYDRWMRLDPEAAGPHHHRELLTLIGARRRQASSKP